MSALPVDTIPVVLSKTVLSSIVARNPEIGGPNTDTVGVGSRPRNDVISNRAAENFKTDVPVVGKAVAADEQPAVVGIGIGPYSLSRMTELRIDVS